MNDKQFKQMLEDVGTLDAEQFQDLILRLEVLAGEVTADGCADKAWTNVRSALALAGSLINQRLGN